MRVVLTGGGTGGHIYPGLAVAAALQRLGPVELLWVGAERGLEKELVTREGLPLVTFPLQAFQRRLSFDTLRTAWRAAAAFPAARATLARFRPDVVLGTGGYACGPVVLTARLMGIPTAIQEQNALPGWTNRVLGRVVDRVALGFGEAERFFPKAKCVLTGNPLRAGILTARREEGQARFGLDPGKRTVLVFGGSQGARAINRATLAALPGLVARRDCQLLWVTGTRSFAEVSERLAAEGAAVGEQEARLGDVHVFAYLHDMPLALAAADLAVSRASAMALSEMAVRGLPSILIPLPSAAENHQEWNARAREKAGASVMLLERDLSGERLGALLAGLLADPVRLARMESAARTLGRPQAAEAVARLLHDLARVAHG
ncbi:MAG: undecaprenyldiphospho-muramoylpentapeptide beta-N-acetylglucosaminyltransferase [Chitinophagales bacterium]